MTLQEALQEFLFQKRIAGVNKNTIHTYYATISLMLKSINPDLPIEAVTYRMFTDYVEKLLDSNISRATKSSYIRNDKIFLKWVYDEYGLSFDPRKIKVPKSPKKNVHIYTDDEILKIFEQCTTSVSWITARNRAIIAFMLDSGLRQLEVCGILKENIDTDRMVLKVTGKGAKDRLVPLGSSTVLLLNAYMDLCPFKDSDYVFHGRRGEQLTGNAIRLFVYRLEHKLGFSLSSHKLRHNFATNFCLDNLEQKGTSNVYDLGIIMGHESIETTKKYEHFAHEYVAVKSSISHLDMCLGNHLNAVASGSHMSTD